MTVRSFDLNIERVLEHWDTPQALREIIANALDEQALTQSRDATIFVDGEGSWHIRDWGRGLSYEHLTQNENREKLNNPNLVIGKFGVGLKDALATFDRRRIVVTIHSRHGQIQIGKKRKHGFEDLSTLHAFIDDPVNATMAGTEFVLTGVKDTDVEAAKSLFLRYSGDELLETTQFGEILRRPEGRRSTAKIYVNGLQVALEENFLFSYNITAPTKRLLKALNRERTNVGRTAYTDRVKDVLLGSCGHEVANALAHDLQLLDRGTAHDELQWLDVAVHACQVLNRLERVIFVTATEAILHPTVVDRARNDGFRVVVVPDTVRTKLPGLFDGTDQPVRDLGRYLEEWDQSFHYSFVAPQDLTADEREIWTKTIEILQLCGEIPHEIVAIKISETMRLHGEGFREALGVWDSAQGWIVVKRSQLSDLPSFAGVLIHELVHAKTGGADDLSNEFVNGLTEMLGVIAAHGVGPDMVP